MQHALVFSALIAATNPIAVVTLFKRLDAPKRLAMLMEGESLLNDSTAVVFFTLILALVISGSSWIGGTALDLYERLDLHCGRVLLGVCGLRNELHGISAHRV